MKPIKFLSKIQTSIYENKSLLKSPVTAIYVFIF